MEVSTGLVVDGGESLLANFQRAMEERIVETHQSRIFEGEADCSPEELQYIAALRAALSSGNFVSSEEEGALRLLKEKLALATARITTLQADRGLTSSFRKKELELVVALHEAAADGIIDAQEHRELEELTEKLRISPQRAEVLSLYVMEQLKD